MTWVDPSTAVPFVSPVRARDESLVVEVSCFDDRLSAPVMVCLAGEFGRSSAPALTDAVRFALRRRPAIVLLDLTRLVSVDAKSLLGALLRAAHTVALCDGHLRAIARPGQPAFHAITSTGLEWRLALYLTPEAALA